MFLQGDVDNDGYLDCREFVAISVHLRRIGDDEEHLRKAFDFFDQNLSGYIEIEELRSTLADEIDENSEEVINAIINDVDTDKVSFIFQLILQLLVNIKNMPTMVTALVLDLVPLASYLSN